MEQQPIECHPFNPFLPKEAKVLMLGSFPPPQKRWAMDFYYPNKTNDMWRIMGLMFYGDKNKFFQDGKYDLSSIQKFASSEGIAFYDAATKVVRLKGNASDQFLKVVDRIDLFAILDLIPQCKAVVTAGEKSSKVIAEILNTAIPGVSQSIEFIYKERKLMFCRMVSSSRAYPMAVEEKARQYAALFRRIGFDVKFDF